MPVVLGHGTDDACADVSLGLRARDLLCALGLEVTWKEYTNAEAEAHRIKEPEQVMDIVDFLLQL